MRWVQSVNPHGAGRERTKKRRERGIAEESRERDGREEGQQGE